MDLKIALIGKNNLLLSLRNMNVTIFQTSDISLKKSLALQSSIPHITEKKK